MKFSIILLTLQLATATNVAYADVKDVDFGRALHRHYTSPIERLRHSSSKTSKVVFVEEEIEAAAETAAKVATGVASKIAKKGYKVLGKASKSQFNSMPDFFGDSNAKASKVLRTRVDFSYDYVLPKSSKAASYDYQDSAILAKASKTENYFSYGYYDPSFADVESMIFDFSDDETSAPTPIPTIYSLDALSDGSVHNTEEEEQPAFFESKDEIQVDSGFDNNFGRLVFEYLSACSGADLKMDTCLTSMAIYYLTSFDAGNSTELMSSSSSRGRFLQTLNEDECTPPDIEESFLNFTLDSSAAQCKGIGQNVSTAEFQLAHSGFTTIFSNQICWAALCDESSNPSDLFFKILFAEAARCAGVNVDKEIPPCVQSHIFGIIFTSEDPSVGRVRRSLAKESSSCEPPSMEELIPFVTFLLTGAPTACDDITFDRSVVYESLLKIFGSSDCWGIDDCNVDDDIVTQYPYDEEDWWPVVTMDGTVCDLEPYSDPLSTRTVDLSYFYLFEAASGTDEEVIASIQGIERSFITYVCGLERRRSLEQANDDSYEYSIISVDSNPLDNVSSDYVCNALSSGAEACFVIEGTLTVTIDAGLSPGYDDELKTNLYEEQLNIVFTEMRVEDPNVIAVKYLGHEASSLSSFDSIYEVKQSTSEEDTGLFSAVIYTIGGSLVVVGAALVAKKKVQPADDPVHPNEKDDGSDAQQTSDLTTSNSLDDRSEMSNISPTNRYCPEAAVGKHTMTKHFILAEEEAENWGRLGITSSAIQGNDLLEVYEEDTAIDEQSI